MKKAIMTVLLAVMLAAGTQAQQPDYSLMIFNHQIAIGMTFANVQAAWGNPKDVNRSITQFGVTEDWWYLQGGNIVLVTFHNGTVNYIGQ